ncbi:substrate-binding periplasmic protein [Kordiimonas pumila]|uniref:Substrate-binding periplasmic protein n=1 Tax=Kordiimonas pumila TaxID=2161677 RepID=A0ABV7D1Y2_9PROT|nr:transporter substrate-binding domain-containing protein [Kordiimonas pumila]
MVIGVACSHIIWYRFWRLYACETFPAFWIALLLNLATFAIAPANAKEPLRLATRIDLPPYVMNTATNGIEVDIIKEIFREFDQDIIFIQMPRIRMIQMFDDSKIDGILTQNSQASNVGCVTNWYLFHQNFAFSLAENNFLIDNLSDLQNYSIVSFDGAKKYLGSDFTNAVKENPRYLESSDQSVHIELLYKKRFDVVVGDEWVFWYIQKKYQEKSGVFKQLNAHHILPPSLYSARFQDPAICSFFDQALAMMRKSGRYDEIERKYHEQILSKDQPRATLPWSPQNSIVN